MNLSNTVKVPLLHYAQGPPFFNGGLKTNRGFPSYLAGLLMCIPFQSVSGVFFNQLVNF